MGQEQSSETVEVSTEQLSQELALKFASKCYTQLELYCFKEVFRTLADTEAGLRYWTEPTLCRFLELPDALNAGPVIYHMVTMLGAFPFMSQAPAIVSMDALLRVITLMTERYKKVLKRGHKDRNRLLFTALAVFDRRASESLALEGVEPLRDLLAPHNNVAESSLGFDIDQPVDDEAAEPDDDELALAALDSLDAIEAIGLGDRPNTQSSIIPSDNFLRLLQLLLLLAPLQAQESLSQYTTGLSDDGVTNLRKIASAVLYAFDIDDLPGITYHSFKTVIPNSLPFVFEGLSPLFEHFLFEKDFDLSKRKRSESITKDAPTSPGSAHDLPTSPQSPSHREKKTKPILPLLENPGEILTTQTLCQLSFFIPPSAIFHRVHPLYSGTTHGFSMGSFEKAVFTWKGPTILLVSGSLLPIEPANSRERTLDESLPPRRFPSSVDRHPQHRTNHSNRVTYGAYVSSPWKQSQKSCFGDNSTILFQLDPVHDVFRASELSKNYVSYVNPTPSTIHPGINFGTPLPTKADRASALVPLGPISLYLDDGLEYAVFTHTANGGGSFMPSVSPARTRFSKEKTAPAPEPITPIRRSRSSTLVESQHQGNWQDRFEIESLEVWGVGGEDLAAKRRRDQEWEEREARMRSESLGGRTGDYEADKEILRLAGLLGHGQDGGSMQWSSGTS